MADMRTYQATPAQLSRLANVLSKHGVNVDLLHSGVYVAGKWDLEWNIPAPAHICIAMKSHPFGEEDIFWNQVQQALTT